MNDDKDKDRCVFVRRRAIPVARACQLDRLSTLTLLFAIRAHAPCDGHIAILFQAGVAR
ncbi:hypothetical protein [Tardiphaga alba]|uniref:hypothetical protein n=1 Tax=Tardiphaga alba TaxID=340268 RepID=UPI001BA5BB68|nr:hypothetical protein [Tardiphaga alba]